MTNRILVTSALPYINGVKHLGNLVGSMLPADVYSRFQRQRLGAENVLFICATDEHGTPAELAALEEGLAVSDYCAKWHTIQKTLSEGFGLSFDYFGRSSSPENHALTQSFAQALWEGGYLEERTTRQVFSPTDGRFLPDRYVIGTCPHCGYDRARGDQCENCTRVLDPVDLIAPRSALSGSPDIEIRDSKHLFLKQTAFEVRLREWIEGKRAEWPSLVTSIALKWLDEGLQDRGITRDLSWGVPVNAAAWGANPSGAKPDVEGLTGKVFYVWFDAPIAYIGASAQWGKATGGDFESWWRGEAARDVTYVEFMGKDNVPFHTVGFPCTLLGVNDALPPAAHWKLVDELKGFNWLTYYGGKFSTSQKRGVFMDRALELLPADYWRWYLIANAPEGSDSSFTWPLFAATVNKDLADVLGNFVNRVLKFAVARFEGVVPEGGQWGEAEHALAKALDQRRTQLGDLLAAREFRKAAQELRAIWVLGNEYITEAAPWTAIKTDRDKAAMAVRLGVNLIHLTAHFSSAFIPASAHAIHTAVNGAVDLLPWPGGPIADELTQIGPGHRFAVPDLLFRKIDDAQVAAWEAEFGGEG
ncbi:MAG: methionine--tRNA ligase [Alphaproteobacteria bacterium]|nr:methionine--tRNA ligase [Alphaproteobacteria bacterium]